jgi:DNA-binding response OmpR family regulator
MPANGQPPHILCINHSPDILGLYRDLLEEDGFRVSTLLAMDRDLTAIAALTPDAVIIDFMETSSDDEWTFLTMLTIDPRTHHIPLILCTAAVRQAMEMEPRLARIGVRVVFKPFDIATLVRAVRAALNQTPVHEPGRPRYE